MISHNSLAPNRRLRRAEASAYLKATWGVDCSPRTLAKYATLGGGPRFQHAGRFPLYMPAELDAWATARLSGLKISTADPGRAA